MPLSPDDIERRQFLPALRGYDRDQVDAFLTEVAEDYRSLLRKFELFQKQQQAAPPEASAQLSGLGERGAGAADRGPERHRNQSGRRGRGGAPAGGGQP